MSNPYIEVSIDIKPGSDVNPINLKSRGRFSVALMSSEDFDAVDVDVEGMRLEEAAPVHHSFKDVDADGDVDLVMHFKTQNMSITPDQAEAVVIGQTTVGKLFMGYDVIKVIE